MVFDLGEYDFNFFHRIDLRGGYFISRLTDGANPLIVDNHLTCRGNSIDLEGKKLQDVLERLKRQTLDLTVEIEVQMQTYRGTRSTRRKRMRLVGRRNDETGEYHLYLTNIDAETLSVEDIAETYRLRWQIEILIKQLCSHNRLDEVPSSKQHVAEILLYASMIALLVSRSLLRELRTKDRGEFYPTKRF